MRIVEQSIRRLTIDMVPGLDPIRVALEDISSGKGRINIECFSQSWAAYWGGMGGQAIAEFFCSCDEHYLASKLSSIPSDIFDPDRLKETLKKEIISNRKQRILYKDEARGQYDAVDDLSLPDSVDQLWTISNEMHEMLGDEWWHSLPMKPNPDYLYLCRIIKTVQAALKAKEMV